MSSSIGERLKEIRESQGVSLDTIALKTHISLAYLQAIETGDEESLPSQVHLRGFLRLYANELGVELEDLQVSGYHLTSEGSSPIPSTQSDLEYEQDQDLHPETIEPEAQPDDLESNVQPKGETAVLPPSQPITQEIDGESEYDHSQTSVDIFTAIGEKIKNRRQLLSLSIKDIFENIHIKEGHLESIESGAFGNLPSPVQARGMLANYADFLNLDTDALLLEYTDGLQLQRIEKLKDLPQQKKRSGKEISPTKLRLKNFFSLDLLVISTLFIAFSVFVIWGVNRILANGTTIEDDEEIPDVSDILLATDAPTPYLTTTPDTTEIVEDQEDLEQDSVVEEIPLFTLSANTDPINLILIPRQRLWVEVTADDDLVFRGRLIPGNAYDFSGQNRVDILTGNAGALQILFNDQDIGSAGLVGQVANLSFNENGLILPPPTLTPTITTTPQTTPTPTPTTTETDG
jgi:cytoskeletal protein RodZ